MVGAAVAATNPLLEHVGTVAFLAMAAALGSGSGATFALIAKVTDPSEVGGVTGLVGAAGGLGGFVPPLIMGFVYGRTDSYAIGLWHAVGDRGADAGAHPDCRAPDRAHRHAAARPHDVTTAVAPRPTDAPSGPDVGRTRSSEALVRTRRFFTRGRGLRRPAHPDQARAAARPTTSTATAGATTRWCARPTA